MLYYYQVKHYMFTFLLVHVILLGGVDECNACEEKYNKCVDACPKCKSLCDVWAGDIQIGMAIFPGCRILLI